MALNPKEGDLCCYCRKPAAAEDNFCRFCGKSLAGFPWYYHHWGVFVLTFLALGPFSIAFTGAAARHFPQGQVDIHGDLTRSDLLYRAAMLIPGSPLKMSLTARSPFPRSDEKRLPGNIQKCDLGPHRPFHEAAVTRKVLDETIGIWAVRSECAG